MNKKDLSALLLGFLTLSFQIYLMREFCAHFFGNEISLGLLLGSWLLWGGIGSIFASNLKYRPERLYRLGFLVVILACFMLTSLRFSRFLLNILPGELTGIAPILLFALVLGMILSTPFGILFVFNVRYHDGNLSRVYILESLGAAAAGLFVHLLLIPWFSNWWGTAVIGGTAAVMIFFFSKSKASFFFLTGVLTVLSLFVVLDNPSQKIYWKPFTLVDSADSPYGKLHVIKTEEQVSLYDNNFLVYSYPDHASAEESVHFALLQHPEAENVLLIGGAAGGGLAETLKYPRSVIDYVEVDPEIFKLSLQYLPSQGKRPFQDNRVSLYNEDGRAFLRKTQKQYDAIILNLPEPATAQLNRYYTREFFHLCRKKLTNSGILAFKVPSAENYISPQLQTFLSSLNQTLEAVFPHIAVVPGGNNVFLASQRPLSLDADHLISIIEQLGLQTKHVSPSQLIFRLDPFRIQELKEIITTGEMRHNTDLSPVSYFLNSILWGTQFNKLENRIFTFLARINRFWLLDLPLIIFILLLTALWLFKIRRAAPLVPLAVMGFTTIVTEFIIILVFQVSFGSIYRNLSLLFSSFMFGLFLGALISRSRKTVSISHLMVIQAGFVLHLSLFILILRVVLPQIFYYFFLILLGYLGGELFVVSNRLYLKTRKNYGLGYGLDLLGSSLGAMLISSILIPLFGLVPVMETTLLLNSACLLYLIGSTRIQS